MSGGAAVKGFPAQDKLLEWVSEVQWLANEWFILNAITGSKNEPWKARDHQDGPTHLFIMNLFVFNGSYSSPGTTNTQRYEGPTQTLHFARQCPEVEKFRRNTGFCHTQCLGEGAEFGLLPLPLGTSSC